MKELLIVEYEGLTMADIEEIFKSVAAFGEGALSEFTEQFWRGYSGGNSKIIFKVETVTLVKTETTLFKETKVNKDSRFKTERFKI